MLTSERTVLLSWYFAVTRTVLLSLLLETWVLFSLWKANFIQSKNVSQTLQPCHAEASNVLPFPARFYTA